MTAATETAPRMRVRPTIAKKKASPRVALREDEPVHAPKARAVTREPVHEKPTRTRRRKLLNNEDQFYLPVDEIPDECKATLADGSVVISYEWKRYSNMGQEDPFYIASLREQGFEPVNPKRHPNWLPPGYDQPHIIKGGLILMERPIELTLEARAEEKALAKRQVREAEARLGVTPRGELPRNHPGIEARISKEWNRPVPIQQGEE